MPKGPTGQKRPGDVIGAAIKVAKIATQELEDESNTGKKYAIQGGQKGRAARAKRLTAAGRPDHRPRGRPRALGKTITFLI